MLVFIRLLPESVTQNDLLQFVGKAVRSPMQSLFSPSHRIHSIEIRKLSSSTNHTVEFHGIVDIEPAKAAVKAIRKLNRTSLKGKEVEVRKFYQRSALRDRRINQVNGAPSDDRRKRDRRREGMIAERVSISGPIEISYARTY